VKVVFGPIMRIEFDLRTKTAVEDSLVEMVSPVFMDCPVSKKNPDF
jgi:hypothetical protein